MTADQLRPGDHLEWCGMTVTINTVEPAGYNGLYVHCTDDTTHEERRLHYYGNEEVSIT